MKSLMNAGSLGLVVLVLSALITPKAIAGPFSSVTPLTTSSIISAVPAQLPPSYLLATVFVNGIPSAGQIFVPAILPSAPSQAQLSSRMRWHSIGPDGISISCVGVSGVTYSVQRAPTIAGPWTTIATITIGKSGTGTCLDSNPPVDQAFYRISYP